MKFALLIADCGAIDFNLCMLITVVNYFTSIKRFIIIILFI